MPSILTYDFETYYDQQYSLSKITTEEYVRSDLFEVIGIAVKLDDEPTQWFSGTMEETKNWLKQFPWGSSFSVAHNAMFDAAILNWRFDIRPKVLCDTLSMARAVHGIEVGGSLAKLAEHYGLGVKGDEVIHAKGLRRMDFTAESLARYGSYCINDVELTYKLFQKLVDGYPKNELKLIDLTLRMFTEPVLDLDEFKLTQHLQNVRNYKEELLVKVAGGKDLEDAKTNLMSNAKFAALLEEYGVVPPTKISPTTKKEAYAFAKSDQAMQELLEHEDINVQSLVAARIGVKSTIEETRTERFLAIAQRGTLPIPLRYFAAHTSRWGGTDKINLQNLPSRGPGAGVLKKCIRAPEGHVIIDSDSSQIEARMLAWMAGQTDLVEIFEKNNAEILAGVPKQEMQFDPYKVMASAIYNKPANKITDAERFVGKSALLGCFGPDTLVLTDSGWKTIVSVNTTDMVWDGESWVKHGGVLQQGEKEVVTAHGVSATPDHEILTEHGWQEWCEVATNPTHFQSAIRRANLPWLIGSSTPSAQENLPGGIQSLSALVDGPEKWTATTSNRSALHDATFVQKYLPRKPQKNIGGMPISSRIPTIVRDCLTELQAASAGVTQRVVGLMQAMAGAASPSMLRGGLTAGRSCGIWFHCPIGTILNATSTASTTAKDMSQITCGSQQKQRARETNAQYPRCNKRLMTYDIAFAGPKNRYTIATDAGALIVHNCGYGMGPKKFQLQMKTFKVNIEYDEAKHIIDTYRYTYGRVPLLWNVGDRCLRALIDNQGADYGEPGIVRAAFGMVHTPMGIPLRYNQLRRTRNAKGEEQLVYTSRTGITGIWGGKFTENIIQHLARIVIGEQMIRIAKRYRVVLTVHDAVACIAPKEEAKEAVAYVEQCMRWVPEWAKGLPLNCESGMGETYGDC